MLTFYVAEAIWSSLNVDVNLCRSMYKSFVELNGRDFPMMLGEHHLVLNCKSIFYFFYGWWSVCFSVN